jgi:hypothetical protein
MHRLLSEKAYLFKMTERRFLHALCLCNTQRSGHAPNHDNPSVLSHRSRLYQLPAHIRPVPPYSCSTHNSLSHQSYHTLRSLHPVPTSSVSNQSYLVLLPLYPYSPLMSVLSTLLPLRRSLFHTISCPTLVLLHATPCTPTPLSYQSCPILLPLYPHSSITSGVSRPTPTTPILLCHISVVPCPTGFFAKLLKIKTIINLTPRLSVMKK